MHMIRGLLISVAALTSWVYLLILDNIIIVGYRKYVCVRYVNTTLGRYLKHYIICLHVKFKKGNLKNK